MGRGEAGGACHLPAEAGTSGSGLPQPAGEKVAPVPPQGQTAARLSDAG